MVKKLFASRLWLPLTLVLLLLINWLASMYHTRIDFTDEKRFTLSSTTKKLLKSLPEEVQVDVFLSGEMNSGFKKLANSTEEILTEFKEASGNKVFYNFISPDEKVEGTNVSWGDTLSATGFYPINLTTQVKAGQKQQLVYPVALVHYRGNTEAVTLFQGKSKAIDFAQINSAEALMEFNFAQAISKLTNPVKPMLAYALGHGEAIGGNVYDLSESILQPNYNLKLVNLKTEPLIPDTFKLLMVVKPTMKFSDEEKFKIDQFVMRGGKLLMFIDRLNTESDSLKVNNEVVAFDRGLDLNEMLFKYGVKINPDLIMDLQCDYLPFDVNGNGQLELLPWNYYPVFESANNHPINKNLGFVSGRFVNSIDTTTAEGIKKTFLLTTSSTKSSRTISSPAVISGRENVNAPQDEKYNRASVPAAVLLEGRFESMFKNRVAQAMNDSLAKYGYSFYPQNMLNNKMIIVSDGDMVMNSYSKEKAPLPMGLNPYTIGTQREFPFANRAFVENCLDYLVNPYNLAEAKAKDYTLRLLDKKKTEDGKTFWQIMNIALPVLLVLLFAFIYQWARKRKYTK